MNFDEVVNRKGTFCTQWDFVEDRFSVPDLLPFTISDTDFKIPEEVYQTLERRLDHRVFGYTRWNHEPFKKSVIDWYRRRFTTAMNSDWLVYSPSVMYTISKLIQLNSAAGDGVVVQTPAYDAFYKTIEANQRQIVTNPLIYADNYYTIDFEDLEKKLAQAQNKILLLCSPHNPTGRVWTTEELTQIVDLCDRYDVFLISDEIHMDVLRKGITHQPITRFTHKKVAILSSGSKTFNFPGLVFSYAFIPNSSLREAFLIALKNQDGLSSASNLGMLATMSAYNDCENWVEEFNLYIDQNIKIVENFVKEHLPAIKINRSESTYLMWLDTRLLNLPMDQLQERLIHIGKVAIMDGRIYGGNGAHFLRLNVGCSKEKLLDGLNRLKMSLACTEE